MASTAPHQLSASTSRSGTSQDDTGGRAGAMLLASVADNIPSSSLTTTTVRSEDTSSTVHAEDDNTPDGSTSPALSRRSSFGARVAAAIHLPSSGSPASALANSARLRERVFRERLRMVELERDELRRVAEMERAKVAEMRRLIEEERAIAERIKRENASVPSAAEAEFRLLQLRYDALEAGTAAPVRSTAGIFKAACSTDLLFLMDTTGSMCSYIQAAKDQVKSIMEDIKVAFFNEADVRIAVVGYKDHMDKPSIQFLDFTPDTEQVLAFLDELTATGGGDEPEDVLGGIQQALNATWQQPTRCIIHIADAPPHGNSLNDLAPGVDTYPSPGSEPHKLTHEPLLKQMIGLNINYALLRIKNSTDRMALTFFQAYAAASANCKLHPSNKYHSESRNTSKSFRGGSRRSAKAGLQFEEVELGTTYSALQHLVVKSVTTSASRTAMRMSPSSGRTSESTFANKPDLQLEAIREDEDDPDMVLKTALLNWEKSAAPELTDNPDPQPAPFEDDEEEAEAELETGPPRWDKRGWLDETLVVEAFSTDAVVHGAAGILDDMMANDNNNKISTTELTIHKRSRPFAQGALRVAAYARTAASTNRLVVKSFKKGGKRLAHLAEDMRCQSLCKAFALEFNALSGEEHSLDFIMVTCLKPKSGTSSAECMTLEPFIEGTYVKYNSNSGYVNEDSPEDPFNQAAQAYSHFTFERSQGRFLISDLQGVGNLLTDPAIHTLDPQRFKLADTNLGHDGFKFFFATHKCNDVCRKLGLKSNASMMISRKFDFRDTWPTTSGALRKGKGTNMTVCCSNKLCSRIVRVATAKKSDQFPGYYWCDACWPQLRSSMVKLICVGSGLHHDFEVSKFFYESQGQIVPRKCSGHRASDDFVPKPGAVGLGGNVDHGCGARPVKAMKDWLAMFGKKL